MHYFWTFEGASFSAEPLLDDGASNIVPLLSISSLRSTTRRVEELVFPAANDFPLFVLAIEAVLLTISDNPFFIWLFKVFDSFSPCPLNVPDLAFVISPSAALRRVLALYSVWFIVCFSAGRLRLLLPLVCFSGKPLPLMLVMLPSFSEFCLESAVSALDRAILGILND